MRRCTWRPHRSSACQFLHPSRRSPHKQPSLDKVLQRPVSCAQYTSKHFRELLNEHGITYGMGWAGEVWDNSFMKSFFLYLKTERVVCKVYRTRSQARADVMNYIEVFYNPTRRHPTLG